MHLNKSWLFDLGQVTKLSLDILTQELTDEYQVLCWHVMIMYDDYISGTLKAVYWY